jgi:formate hydrogenlyase subunit 6/NADH:ubiquinone oxidoreductase subunit I
MFSCRDATRLMTDEGEAALRGWQKTQYRLHMFVCVYCRRCKRQLDDAIALSKEIPPEEVSSRVEEDALAAFRARPKS